MDMMSKIAIGIGLTGAAIITGAGIQAAIDEHANERRDMRNDISELETKMREVEYDITRLKSEDDRARSTINEVNNKLNRHIIDESVKKKGLRAKERLLKCRRSYLFVIFAVSLMGKPKPLRRRREW